MARDIYMGKKIAEIIDLRKTHDTRLEYGKKCSCGRSMCLVGLSLKFENGTTQDFCNSCREDILGDRETPEEKWVKIREIWRKESLEEEAKWNEFFGIEMIT